MNATQSTSPANTAKAVAHAITLGTAAHGRTVTGILRSLNEGRKTNERYAIADHKGRCVSLQARKAPTVNLLPDASGNVPAFHVWADGDLSRGCTVIGGGEMLHPFKD